VRFRSALRDDAPSLVATIVAAAVATLYLSHLDAPRDGSASPTYVFDECYQAFTAHRYVLGDPNAWQGTGGPDEMAAFDPSDVTPDVAYEWTHPPTAKLVMAAFIRAFGFVPFAYRIGSVLAGFCALALVYVLARRMRGSSFAAVALLIAACDGMLLVMSRIAMTDIYLTAAILGGFYACYRFLQAPRSSPRWLVIAGAALGIAISVKWNAAVPLLVIASLTLPRVLAMVRASDPASARYVAAWCVGFVLLPVCIYLLAYLPFFLAGHDASDFIVLQVNMFGFWFHHRVAATHPFASPWWSWPLLLRPVWFYSHSLPDGRESNIFAMGNPLIWWMFVPALLWTLVRFVRGRSLSDGIIAAGFLGLWLPWALAPGVTFVQYLLPAVPFGVLAITGMLSDIAKWKPRFGPAVAVVYLVGCIGLFAHLYPLWTGLPVAKQGNASAHAFWLPAHDDTARQ
jgi:dolichyl-phosphate-mannose-protein mannosyltransferase